MGALALTEHGNISSHIQLEQAALKEGVKPIFGCEIYMAPPESKRKYHLTVLAQTPEGYSNLMRLVSDAWKNFYYEPTVTWETLRRYRRGLVILSGCTGSLLACHMVGGKDIPEAEASYQRARKTALIFKRTFGENYFLEVQAFPELEKVRQINVAYERLSNELGIPLVATGDCHYTRPSENEMQQILHNVRGGNRQTLEEQARNWGYDVPLSPPASDGYVYRRLRATGLSHTKALEAVATTADIASACTVTLPKLDRLRYPLPRGTAGTSDLWRAWLQEGWAYRGIPQRRNVGDYVRKLKYEINIIEQKDFVDYFLVVSDIVKFAKDSGIPVGPARGSAAASLVCYLLRITEVDPLAFPSLMFERFIDLTRMDLPDIDLDFDSSRRREIWDYAEAKYGPERVGNIGSFVKYKAKVSLDDVARVYRIPQGEVETVKELLIERSSGDLRPSDTIEDTFEQHERAREVVERHPDLAKATLLEGQVKTMGIHAAGLVVANGPLTDVCAVYTRELHKGKGDFVSVISPDKYDADHLNILKIDVLGLSTMTMIRLALDMIGMNLEDLYAIPLDDQAVIAGFQANDVVGVFQFD
jgi:DNA polymerase-3 subunit alpha